jgi:hypothetical protein
MFLLFQKNLTDGRFQTVLPRVFAERESRLLFRGRNLPRFFTFCGKREGLSSGAARAAFIHKISDISGGMLTVT